MRNRVHDTTTWHQCLLLLLLSKKYPHLPSFGPAATLYLNLSHLNFCISLYKKKRQTVKKVKQQRKCCFNYFVHNQTELGKTHGI